MNFIKMYLYLNGNFTQKEGDKMFIQCNFEELKRHGIINPEDMDSKISEDFLKYLSKIFKQPKFKDLKSYTCRDYWGNTGRIEVYIPIRMFKNDDCD